MPFPSLAIAQGQLQIRALRATGPQRRRGQHDLQAPATLSFSVALSPRLRLGPLWGVLPLSLPSTVPLAIFSKKVFRSGLACSNKGLFVPRGLSAPLPHLSFPWPLLLL